MENVALQNQLQAIQLGANLAARRQQRQQIEQQIRQSSAEFLLRKNQSELQNKILENNLGQALAEQRFQMEEFEQFSNLSKQVGDYLDNPTENAKFPVVPAFKSKQYRLEADKMINNLEKYSARAKLMRAQYRAEVASDGIAASTLNKAIQYGALIRNPDGSFGIDVDALNARAEELRQANIAKTGAQTSGLIGNLEIARGKLKVAEDNLERLKTEGASKVELEKAKLEINKQLDEQEMLLKERRFELAKMTSEARASAEQQRIDISKERIELLRQKLLQQYKSSDAKLNAVDDRVVKKTADDIANKQTISDAIGYEIGILENPSVDKYVALNSAKSIAKVLNSAEGKDAVGVEEAKRLLQELEFFSGRRFLEGGQLLGPDMESFVKKIKIKKGELDSRINEGKGRINSIYKQYGFDMPASTGAVQPQSQTAPAPAAVAPAPAAPAPAAVGQQLTPEQIQKIQSRINELLSKDTK